MFSTADERKGSIIYKEPLQINKEIKQIESRRDLVTSATEYQETRWVWGPMCRAKCRCFQGKQGELLGWWGWSLALARRNVEQKASFLGWPCVFF